jgi:transcriptional regulator with XRE-family HTH domain
VDTENGSPPDPDDLPSEDKTVNQIVAWNIAYYRRAAGITQERLGEMIGRSKRNVSADERSWDGGHTREFNAQEIATLAAALGVPIGALFLPPEDDGVTVRYKFRPGGRDGSMAMGDLMVMIMPDSSSGSRAMDAYRRRIGLAVRQYLGVEWNDEPGRWREIVSEKETRAEQAEDARQDREFLLRLAAKLGRVVKAYEEDAG